MLDRLVKDIVSESAASYVSILSVDNRLDDELRSKARRGDQNRLSTTFSLPRFIPLLQERIHVINPFTRIFLVNWIVLLDSVPDLELVSYLPFFLKGLFKFLSDPSQEVHSATQRLLNRILSEIQKISRIKKSVAISQGKKLKEKSRQTAARAASTSSSKHEHEADHDLNEIVSPDFNDSTHDSASDESESRIPTEDARDEDSDDWQPDQDVQIDYLKILEILVSLLTDSCGEANLNVLCLHP